MPSMATPTDPNAKIHGYFGLLAALALLRAGLWPIDSRPDSGRRGFLDKSIINEVLWETDRGRVIYASSWGRCRVEDFRHQDGSLRFLPKDKAGCDALDLITWSQDTIERRSVVSVQ